MAVKKVGNNKICGLLPTLKEIVGGITKLFTLFFHLISLIHQILGLWNLRSSEIHYNTDSCQF